MFYFRCHDGAGIAMRIAAPTPLQAAAEFAHRRGYPDLETFRAQMGVPLDQLIRSLITNLPDAPHHRTGSMGDVARQDRRLQRPQQP